MRIQSPRRAGWRLALAASLTFAAVAGCQPGTASGPAASGLPSAAPSGASASPLPGASVDSDLDAEAQAAIENLLDGDELNSYLASDLIHDGGVILYKTMAAPGEARIAQAVPTAPPEAWRRIDVERGGRQLKLRRVAGTPAGEKLARVTVRFPQRGVLAYRDTSRGAIVRKPFVETFERTFVFQLSDGAWRLTRVGPITFETQGGNSPVDITDVAVYRAGQAEPVALLGSAGQELAPDALPTLNTGEEVRLEVKASSRVETGLFVFAHLAGQRDRSREQLLDDGTNGDRVAGDGIYTRTFVMPATPALRNFGIDAIDRRVFTPGGLYRAEARGVSFRVQKPE